MAFARATPAPAALVALATVASLAHAIMTQDGSDRSIRADAIADKHQITETESAAMHQMAASIPTWQDEEKQQDNLFVKMFRHYFTFENMTNATEGHDEELNFTSSTNFTMPDSRLSAEETIDAEDWLPAARGGDQARDIMSERNVFARGGSLGADVPLDQMGYRILVEQGHKHDMEEFAKRILEEKKLRLVDTETFHEVLRYYDGECATQTFHALKAEMRRATVTTKCRSAWLEAKGAARTRHAPMRRILKQVGNRELLGVALTAPMNQLGYKRVADLGMSEEMAVYIRRVLTLMDLEVISEWGLQHFVPYHSGECATQRFVRLVDELHRAVDRPINCGGGWLRPIGKANSSLRIGSNWMQRPSFDFDA